MKDDWISNVDNAAKTVTICAAPKLFALQCHSDTGWNWTCDAAGFVIQFGTHPESDQMILDSVKDFETRRIPWAEVPNQLKQLGHCGNRKERRKERSARRREAWQAHQREEK